MDEEKFSEWIRRYNEGTATDEEKAMLEKWLIHRRKADPFEALNEQEKAEIGESIFEGLSARMRTASAQDQDAPGSARARVFRLPVYRLAAAVLLLAAASFVLWQYTVDDSAQHPFEMLTASAAVQGHKVILADGSIVWLKDHSSLVYPSAFTGDTRNVTLAGEALFEVAKDPGHPFIISAGTLTAKVLGTSFNIKATDAHVEVLVLTGKVALSSVDAGQELIVLPNEKALFNGVNHQLSKMEVLQAESEQAVTSTGYSMDFHAATMRDVIRRIEGKFDVSIVLKNHGMNDCTITADFTDQSLERTLTMMAQVLDFSYTIDNDRVTISGSGCE